MSTGSSVFGSVSPGAAETYASASIDEAAAAVRAKFGAAPDVAIILGTGLGGLAAEISTSAVVEYADIPGFPLSTVESHAREIISRVQRMRKESGFSVSDRIKVRIGGGEEVRQVIDAHGLWIAEEVLATDLRLVAEGGENSEGWDVQSIDLDGITATAAITRIE